MKAKRLEERNKHSKYKGYRNTRIQIKGKAWNLGNTDRTGRVGSKK